MPRKKKPWTCLFYLCGDNYLEQDVEDDFREICRAGAAPELHVAVQIDRRSGAARYVLPERRLRQPPQPEFDLGNVNTGDPIAAIDFLTWGMREFPSTHLAVILSGPGLPTMPGQHGEVGTGRHELFSLFPDETSKDALNAAELRYLFAESLKRSKRKQVDVIGLDSCSPAFVEVAYQLEGLAEIMVAPQTYLPGQGWPYDKVLAAWHRHKPATPQALAQLLVTEVIAAYRKAEKHESVALSAINLKALDRVARSLDALTLGLMQSLGDWTVYSALRKTRTRLQGIEWPENVDLLELLTVGEKALRQQRANAQAGFGEKERASALADLIGRALRVIKGSDVGPPLILANEFLTQHSLNGISIHFPRSLAGSEYLKLRFARKVHWAALLGGLNLIEDHPRALWRLVSAMMADASGATRQELIERMLGPDSVMEGLKEQFRALESPPCLTLSLERRDDLGSPEAETRRVYRLRLEQPEAGATIPESNCRVNQLTFDNVLLRLERLLNSPSAGAEALPQIVSLGRTLEEDLFPDLAGRLRGALMTTPRQGEETASAMGDDGRERSADEPAADREETSAPHLRLQIAAELMRQPWELLHDGEQLLGLRYAVGRQVFMEVPTLRAVRRRTGGEIRVLVIGDPQFSSGFLEYLRDQKRPVPRQLAGAQAEAEKVAQEFERLGLELAGLPPLSIETVIGQSLTVTEMRERLRAGYHLIHFAGHGVFRRTDPETSAWLLSDGELWAREIRNTLARQEEPPWLIFANACEAGMDAGAAPRRYQGDVFGLATACINQGVAAYIAPLWPVEDALAAQLATDFYGRLLLKRLSVGEALCQAKRKAYAAMSSDQATARQLTWASFVLYGDPTQQLLRTLWSGSGRPRTGQPSARSGRLSEATVRTLVTGSGMRVLAGDGERGATPLAEGEVELQLVEKNGVRYWQRVVAQEAPQPLGIGPRLAQAAAAAGGERGLLDVLRIVEKWAVGVLIGQRQSLITELARQYDRETVPEQGLVTIGSDGRCASLSSWDWLRAAPPPGQTDRVLLFIHGTFSQTSVPLADFSAEFLAWAHRTYRGVIGFDHWTLSETPEDNARLLWNLLDPELHTGHRLDIVTHSRGGLIARALVELLGHSEAVRRVVFVGTPNAGTNLANPENWGIAADVLINLANLSPIFIKLSGLLARFVIGRVEGRIPGLQAQNPSAMGVTDFLGRLQQPTSLPQGVSYSAVAANYEPKAGELNLKGLLAQVEDLGADAFYRHANDLVVDTGSVWAVDTKPDYGLGTAGQLVPPNRLLLFNPDRIGVGNVEPQRGVHHNNLFAMPKTMEFLETQLA